MPPDDPFGRNGPTLDAFLRRPKYGLSSNTQPCPYEKKCTYGNKCKFYHADRGNQPQKSITEKLKENSSKRINEVRARSPSNESCTGKPNAIQSRSEFRTPEIQEHFKSGHFSVLFLNDNVIWSVGGNTFYLSVPPMENSSCDFKFTFKNGTFAS